jgi:hypothetical protein
MIPSIGVAIPGRFAPSRKPDASARLVPLQEPVRICLDAGILLKYGTSNAFQWKNNADWEASVGFHHGSPAIGILIALSLLVLVLTFRGKRWICERLTVNST